ncbi:MAG: hypothetical protein U1E53_23980 [Dongiaceae bacterium]
MILREGGTLPGTTVALPAPPAGWVDIDRSVLMDGTLALVRADHDVIAERRRRRAGNPGAVGPLPAIERFRVSVFDGRTETSAVELPGPAWWWQLDRLADGRWLLVTDKARLFTPDGRPDGEFDIGRHFELVRCAPDGTIWAGYYDQGTTLDRDAGGQRPVSWAGVAQFEAEGIVRWDFNDEYDRGRVHWNVFSCWLLTVSGDGIWCCIEPEFPIVRITEGRIRWWRNEVHGARALAVDGDHVLLAGGWAEDRSGLDRLALVRLEDDRARPLGAWHHPLIDGAEMVQGNGSTLHVVADGQWTRLEVAAMRDAFGA